MHQKRGKRFERASKDDVTALRAHFQRTPRDEAIIRRVGEFRFVNSEQILRLVPAIGGETAKQIPERLKRLWQLHYLDRPRAQLQYFRQGGGSAKIVYALGQQGAKLLSQRDATPIHKLNWTLKNNRVGQLNILHTVEIAEFLSKLEAECTAAKSVALIKGDAIVRESPPTTHTMEKPHRIAAQPSLAGRSFKLAIHPDAVFALGLGTGKQSNFFLEVDRGTMPVARKLSSMRADVRQRSVLEKFMCYAQAWKDGHAERRYGWQHFRVIFVTTSAERVARMVDVVTELAKDLDMRGCKGLFLFADTASLRSTPLLDCKFTNGKGERVGLTD